MSHAAPTPSTTTAQPIPSGSTGRPLATGPTAFGAEPSIGQLVTSLSRDLSTLVRSEIELAKAELRDDVKRAGVGGGMFGAAGYLALLASIVLTIALAYGISALGLAPGWAFLIVGGAYLLLAGLLAMIGLRSVKKVSPPEQTIATTKRTIAVLKRQK
ncbi:MAG: phage holin family protein [Motilibacteraceae bacterium]